MILRRFHPELLAATLAISLAFAAGPVRAQDEDPPVPKDQVKKAEEVIEVARTIGPWENQAPVFQQATDNIFRQQGWTSESDQFAREVMRQVGTIPPWKPREREEVFLGAVQSRFSLTHDQRTLLGTEMRRESMTFMIKHFKDMVPVMLEVAKTRAANEPFTPEQVQEWSRQLRPIMDEGLQMMDRVTGKLKRTMSPDQRRQLEEDLRALRRRHKDTMKMVERWEHGRWSPTDWGLQNDPLHAATAAQDAAREAEKNALVEQARLARNPDEPRIALNESSWDTYVKWFCNTYHCDDRQRTMADSILQRSKREASDYRGARRTMIEQQERLSSGGEANPELNRLLQPIREIFERMKQRLSSEILTTEQRKKYGPAEPVAPRPPPAVVPPPPATAQKAEEPPPT